MCVSVPLDGRTSYHDSVYYFRGECLLVIYANYIVKVFLVLLCSRRCAKVGDNTMTLVKNVVSRDVDRLHATCRIDTLYVSQNGHARASLGQL